MEKPQKMPKVAKVTSKICIKFFIFLNFKLITGKK